MKSTQVPLAGSSQENNQIFYDQISGDYNEMLEKNTSNEIIREKVKQKFISNISAGKIIDFGGGTGLDLNWLTGQQYRIIFCEISEGMRNQAMAKFSNNDILFLDNTQVDFRWWNEKVPFPGKVDGILSDFAVFNCIEDIGTMFERLSDILEKDGQIVALILNPMYKKKLSSVFRDFIKNLISPKTKVINIDYKEFKQIVYVYSLKEIRKASKTYFHLKSSEILNEFVMIHLVKK